jgi:signal transduction histidine kinase
MAESRSSLRRQLEKLRLLARVSSVINTTLEPKQVLNLVLRQAVSIMRASSGSLILINPHTQLLEIEVAIGLSKKAQALRLPIGRGITGWVAKTGRPLRVSDVRRDPRYVCVRKNVRSELAVPLQLKDQLIGVLNVDSVRRNAFSKTDEELLAAVADHAARVIYNAWLYEQVHHKARQLEALLSVGQTIVSALELKEVLRLVTRHACALMNTKCCSLMLLDADGHQLQLKAFHGVRAAQLRTSLPVDDSLLGAVVLRRKPMQVHDISAHGEYQYTEFVRKPDVASLLSVPLLLGEEPRGTLTVYTEKPYRYSNDDIRILMALASLSTVALEKARLYEKVVALEEQLRHNERLSALGLLAAEIAHEIRNPLTVLKMLFHSLDLRFSSDDPRAKDAEIIQEKLEQLNKIVDRVLHFARSYEPSFQEVDINSAFEDVFLLVRHKLNRQKISLHKKLGARLPPVRVDVAQMEQVFLNLLLNAADAMPDGGALTVRTSVERDRSGAKKLVISFTDTGTGMSREQLERLREPFLTTKPRGTGLGLAIVSKIVEQHRGELRVNSARAKGTTVRVLLPVTG